MARESALALIPMGDLCRSVRSQTKRNRRRRKASHSGMTIPTEQGLALREHFIPT